MTAARGFASGARSAGRRPALAVASDHINERGDRASRGRARARIEPEARRADVIRVLRTRDPLAIASAICKVAAGPHALAWVAGSGRTHSGWSACSTASSWRDRRCERRAQGLVALLAAFALALAVALPAGVAAASFSDVVRVRVRLLGARGQPPNAESRLWCYYALEERPGRRAGKRTRSGRGALDTRDGGRPTATTSCARVGAGLARPLRRLGRSRRVRGLTPGASGSGIDDVRPDRHLLGPRSSRPQP